jgi:hypothetical protein
MEYTTRQYLLLPISANPSSVFPLVTKPRDLFDNAGSLAGDMAVWQQALFIAKRAFYVYCLSLERYLLL